MTERIHRIDNSVSNMKIQTCLRNYMHPCPGSPPEPNQVYQLAEQLALFVHYLQRRAAIRR